MNDQGHSFARFADRSLFLVWGPPSHGPRSQVFARELGIHELHFLNVTSQRGLFSALFKYPLLAARTLSLLFRKRPKIVFVQSPPGLAVLFVAFYGMLTGSQYVVDAHSAALLLPVWTKPRWLWASLARRALATIVTNEHFAQTLRSWGARALVIRDIPTTFPEGGTYPLNGDFNVTVVNTFSADEPLEQVLDAAHEMDGVHFYITGRLSRGDPGLLSRAPANVTFTDFLSTEQYYALLRGGHAVMCLTTRDNTMQRGACEALSLAKPIITSHWPLLREYFHQGTVHVENSSTGIRQGVQEMRSRYEEYVSGIRALQIRQRAEWKDKLAELVALIVTRSGNSQLTT
jgi:glycosyltransferase involved in cell wall biosynthesis